MIEYEIWKFFIFRRRELFFVLVETISADNRARIVQYVVLYDFPSYMRNTPISLDMILLSVPKNPTPPTSKLV